MADVNQYSALSTPRDESKDDIRSRKDDMKEQAWQAKEGVKNKAAALKEELVGQSTAALASAQAQLQSGIALAKSKISAATGGKPVEEVVEDLQEAGAEEWETVKRKGKAQAKKASDALDEKLTPAQRAQLAKGVKQAKVAGARGAAKANGLFDIMFSAPQLRGAKQFIQRNNLQVPAMVLMALGSLWLSLTLIRLITSATSPKVPEFDIHSVEATKAWAKYHGGEYKNRAIDAKESLMGRVASFLANHELGKMGVDTDKLKSQADSLKASAYDWREIGMSKLGMHEPTMSEQVWSWVTGRPLTWQDRVQSALDLGRQGLKVSALKAAGNRMADSARDHLGMHHEEPTLTQKLKNYVSGHEEPTASERASAHAHAAADKAHSLGERIVDGVRNAIPGLKHEVIPEPTLLERAQASVHDGIDSIRSHLPGSAEAERVKAQAYAATHASTLDNIKSGAEYVKNRIVHGAEEAAHIAEDRAKRLHDEAKYKTGL